MIFHCQPRCSDQFSIIIVPMDFHVCSMNFHGVSIDFHDFSRIFPVLVDHFLPWHPWPWRLGALAVPAVPSKGGSRGELCQALLQLRGLGSGDVHEVSQDAWGYAGDNGEIMGQWIGLRWFKGKLTGILQYFNGKMYGFRLRFSQQNQSIDHGDIVGIL